MSAIQTNVGLISGIPIQDTVDQLIAIAASPRNLIVTRNQTLTAEQSAVDQLAALTLGMKASLNRFNLQSTFNSRSATSSNTNAVGVTVRSGETPNTGAYQFTPISKASSHQLVSGSFDDITSAVGEGTLKFRFGGHVDKGVDLADLNGGEGFDAGKIKITDRDGLSAVIDLRGAQTVDDVIGAINSEDDIDVTASVEGGRFVLTDNTGGDDNFRVREVSGGTTAASLGLGGLNEAADTLTGADVHGLGANTKLSSLGDGLGVRVTDSENSDGDGAAYDLLVTLSDGSLGSIDLSGATTLGDAVDLINNNDDLTGKLSAEIVDNKRLVLTDTSGGGGSLSVSGIAAEGLGLDTTAAGGTLTGGRLVSGLRDTLVSSLGGGQGIELGEIEITDRSGAVDTLDLSSAETLGEIVDLINGSSAGVTASINSSHNGIEITDTSDGTGNLTIANGSSGTTADDLGITIDSAVGSVDGGALDRQVVSAATRLEAFNGGQGVAISDFRITDSEGKTLAIDMNPIGDEAETLGDVIDRINSTADFADSGVVASLNDAGNGILLTDTSGGSGTLTVTEVGNGTAAADLNLLGASDDTNGSGQQIINGSTSYSVDLTDLEQSAESIALSTLNGGEGVQLGIFNVITADGENFAVDLGESGSEAFTVGDVIDRINEASGGTATASLNSAGTGILLTDNTGGDGELTVEDLGSNGTAAADLNLIRTALDNDDGEINGAGLFSASDGEQGALATLVDRINDLGAGVTAALLNDAGGFRLSITADNTGNANELLIDSASTGFSFQETSRPGDAVALFGGVGGVGGFAVTSESNEFSGVIDGVDISIEQATGEPVTIGVDSDTDALVDVVGDFVAAYNSIRSNLDSVTDFDEETLTTGILFGRNEALRVDADLSRILSGRFNVADGISSLESVGVSLNEDGKLELDTGRLREAFADDPVGVESLFKDEESGVVATLTSAINQLAGDENSLLTTRSDALERTIEDNASRIEAWDGRLERQREQLLLEFYRLEETLALLQSNTDTISSIQPITIANSSNN